MDYERTEVMEGLKPALARVSNGRARLEQLANDSLLIEDVGLASLDLLELRFELEVKWKVHITDDDAIRMKTIGDIVKLILERSRSDAS